MRRPGLHAKLGMPAYHEWPDVPKCVDADPEAFFPPDGVGASEAKVICSGCPVREPCLEYALSLPGSDDFGVFGGTTKRERERLRSDLGRVGRRSTWAA